MPRCLSGPVAGAESGGVDDLYLRAERLPEAVLVLVVHDRVAEAGRDLHRRREDPEKLREARSRERRVPALLTAHGGVHRAVAFGIELRDVEKVRVAEKRALRDRDP